MKSIGVVFVAMALLLGTMACQQEDIFGQASLALSSLRANSSASCSTCSQISSVSLSTSSARPSSQASSVASGSQASSSMSQGSAGSSTSVQIVLGHTPADGETVQSTTGPIVIDFHETVDPASVVPSGVGLTAGGVTISYTHTGGIVWDSVKKIDVYRLTIGGYTLSQGVSCTVTLSSGIKTISGQTLTGGYSFSFTTAAAPSLVSTTPNDDSTVGPVSWVTLNYSEPIAYSGAVVTVSGTAIGTAVSLPSTDLSGTGNVLKVRVPAACYAWSDPGTGPLKTVVINVSGVTTVSGGVTVPNANVTYSLERSWHEVGVFDAAAPITGGNTARTVQLAVTGTHVYLAHAASGQVVLRRYSLSTKTWEDPPDSWSSQNFVYALTSNGTEAYLVREYGSTIFVNSHSGFSASHTPLAVTPTSLDAVASGNTITYVFNSAQAGANYLQAWACDVSGSNFNQTKDFSPASQSHECPSIALSGTAPWMAYADGTSLNMWDFSGSAGYGSWAGFFNGVFRLMYVGNTEVLLFATGSSPALRVSKARPFGSQITLSRTPDSAQADACVMDGTTPIFMYPVDSVGTSSLVCDGWYSGMSDMRPLATQSTEVPSHRADWSVVAAGVFLGARPAIVATPDAAFAAWCDSTQNKVFVRRHDGR